MRISDWSSDVCSSDLRKREALRALRDAVVRETVEGVGVVAHNTLPLRGEGWKRGMKKARSRIRPAFPPTPFPTGKGEITNRRTSSRRSVRAGDNPPSCRAELRENGHAAGKEREV